MVDDMIASIENSFWPGYSLAEEYWLVRSYEVIAVELSRSTAHAMGAQKSADAPPVPHKGQNLTTIAKTLTSSKAEAKEDQLVVTVTSSAITVWINPEPLVVMARSSQSTVVYVSVSNLHALMNLLIYPGGHMISDDGSSAGLTKPRLAPFLFDRLLFLAMFADSKVGKL
jgi:hypothetical protein